ncbi:FAD-dependent monooxygenase [Legionella sp.]|uniref:FAD-dependent monooxygenase n=1 Tax=Legionella sp. TaxID=459 RepID=UPI003C86E287
MNLKFNVLVIGGGSVGLTAALAMTHRGYNVAVIDAGTLDVNNSYPDSRVYAINKASQIFLQQLDVWQHLDLQRVSPYTQMHVWDASNGMHIDFDSRYVAAPHLGVIIEESALKQALLRQIAKQPKISLFPECNVDEVHSVADGVCVSNQQQVWEGKLLMVADGANSSVRQKLNVELTHWSYKQHALVTTVAVEKTHNHTAYQVFNPDGPLAFLPLVDDHQCSIVWSIDPIRVSQLMEFSEEKFNEAITKAFAKKLGQVSIIGARHQFPLQMRHVKQYVGARWLLLGDTAHTIHPLAGLGLNVGLADVCSWVKCLDATKGSLISKKALAAYQRERKYAVWQIIALMEGFKRLFSNSFAPVVTLRGLGLGFCNECIPLKRLFIQHACGTAE